MKFMFSAYTNHQHRRPQLLQCCPSLTLNYSVHVRLGLSILLLARIIVECAIFVVTYVPVNTERWSNGGSMLAHRLRRWPNIDPTLGQRLVFAGVWTTSPTQSPHEPGLNRRRVLYRPWCIARFKAAIRGSALQIAESFSRFKYIFWRVTKIELELRAQSREVVGSNPTSDMMGIFQRPAPTQGEFDTGSMGGSSHWPRFIH